MDVLKGYREIKKSFRDAVLTVGNFDGLHLGHQSILNEVVARAKSLRGQSIVYTFRPHPQAVLSPSRDLELISTYDEKLRLFENAGIDVVIEEPFSREFSGFSAEKFFSDVIVKSIAPRAVFVGYDFGFGKDRSGSLDILKKMCKTEGIDLSIASPLKIENEVCSSSRVRAYLKSGDIVSANRLLGRRFSYQGSVIRGDARGRTIGFPTANLLASAKIQIKNGVYASGTIVTMNKNKKKYPSITNVGVKPTFAKPEDQRPPVVIETHLFDFNDDLYGRTIEIELVERIRDEQKFDSIEKLVEQIRKDVAQTRQLFTI